MANAVTSRRNPELKGEIIMAPPALPAIDAAATESPSATEPCLVGTQVIELPSEVFTLEDPSSLLSLDTWYNVLDDDDRERLARFLPSSERADPSELLEHLFENSAFHFGSPVQAFWGKLSAGKFHPAVELLARSVRVLQRKQHYHDVRRYHDDMARGLRDMRAVWQQLPDADLPQRLQLWRDVKAQGGLSAAGRARLAKSGSESQLAADGAKRKEPEPDAEAALASRGDDSGRAAKRATFDEKPLDAQVAAGSEFNHASQLSQLSQSSQPSQPEGAAADIGFSIRALLAAARDVLMQSRGEGGGICGDEASFAWMHSADIVQRVRERPGDPRALRLSLRFGELVITALKVLQTKAPPGTRLWKPFVQSRRQGSEWAWCGAVTDAMDPSRPVNADPLSWGIAEKGLSRLEERFVKMLQDAGSLPLPLPDTTSAKDSAAGAAGAGGAGGAGAGAPSVDAPSAPAEGKGRAVAGKAEENSGVSGVAGGGGGEGARVAPRDGDDSPHLPALSRSLVNEPRAPFSQLKSQVTLAPASAHMRALFQCEERLRYEIPCHAFRYTATDGGKAMVAPVVRHGAKAVAKARDHAMLKLERPPHVTILSLVRDAAARLPNGIGTRADVCTLLRDSQYFVAESPEAQVNQIVSGAMDRLHYERDPCVKYLADRKMWRYLHRHRVAHDFLPDGTVSTRQWGRKKGGAGGDGDAGDAVAGGADGVAGEGVAGEGAAGGEGGVGGMAERELSVVVGAIGGVEGGRSGEEGVRRERGVGFGRKSGEKEQQGQVVGLSQQGEVQRGVGGLDKQGVPAHVKLLPAQQQQQLQNLQGGGFFPAEGVFGEGRGGGRLHGLGSNTQGRELPLAASSSSPRVPGSAAATALAARGVLSSAAAAAAAAAASMGVSAAGVKFEQAAARAGNMGPSHGNRLVSSDGTSHFNQMSEPGLGLGGNESIGQPELDFGLNNLSQHRISSASTGITKQFF
ncbi:unnamed protein product [Closterium sp. NIES-65]|nr:unnamed protein product [Closterium sp. NIES-65]